MGLVVFKQVQIAKDFTESANKSTGVPQEERRSEPKKPNKPKLHAKDKILGKVSHS